MKRLQAEIKQTKPFKCVEEEAYLNLLKTADALFRGQEALLKKAKLSPPQYNVLRILAGAEPHGLPCRDIADRLLTRDPDITRLLDRLEGRGLVARSRQERDRRVITTRISPQGLQALRQLDQPVQELHRKHLGHLGSQRLRTLVGLLEEARGKTG